MTARDLIFLASATVLCVVAPLLQAQAQQNFPSSAITIVVPLPPGGTADLLARSVAERVQGYTGQPVIVENVTGAAGAIGAERVARAAPDGYTLLVATSTTLSSNPHFYRKLRYKVSDFEPVTLLTAHELAVHIKQILPASNLKELIAYAASKPGGITYSTTGRGSNSEVLGEMMKAAFKIEMRDVPYRGAAPALLDVMKGEIDMHFDGITSTIPHLRSGRSKVIATTGEKRSPATPNIPTLVELGYPGMFMDNIYALIAPKGTPRPVVDRLNALVHRALAEPQLRDRLSAQGAIPRPTTPEGLADVIARDNAFFEKNIRELKLQPVD